MMNKFEKLFSPIDIGSITLANRIVLPPMSVHLSEKGEVTDREIAYLERRAEGGAGLIINGAAFVHPAGNFGGQVAIDRDERVKELSRLVKAAHNYGSKISIQVHHAGRQTNSSASGFQPVAPSAIRAEGYEMPRELSKEEIAEHVEYFAQAVRRARDAGFDAVEMHCAHGYLIAGFMSPYSNYRQDEYGGTFENRMRFISEIFARSRELVGNDYPITCRISGDELVENGIDMALSARIAKHLESIGASAISVSCHLSPYYRTVPNMYYPPGVNVYLAENVKSVVNVPVMTAGRIVDPQQAEDILNTGKADLVGMGRALICDPDLPLKAKEGRVDEIIKCIACNKGCHDRNKTERAIACLLNPETGREQHFRIKPAASRKHVLVVGGGPAGMEAARVAALRGHQVQLFEKEEKLGGRLCLASVPPHKKDYEDAVNYLEQEVRKHPSIELNLGVEADVGVIRKNNPQHVIVATGAVPVLPAVTGIEDSEKAVFAEDILSGAVEPGRKVVVLGGGSIGSETAHFILQNGAEQVYIVEMLPAIAQDLPQDALLHLMEEFEKIPQLAVYTESEVVSVDGSTVTVVHKDNSKEVIKDVDTIVLAVGVRPNNELIASLEGVSFTAVGDCRQPKDALQAIYEGSKAAREI